MTAALISGLIAVVSAQCSWDSPGHNPFMGDVVSAVDSYRDIPEPTRKKLKDKMAKRQYDDVASIKRDSIEGKVEYENLRQMHFGKKMICNQVTRTKWKPEHTERGLIYCEDEYCIIVPTVCRNVSRVDKKVKNVAAGPAEELDIETAAGPAQPLTTSFINGGGGAISFADASDPNVTFPNVFPLGTSTNNQPLEFSTFSGGNNTNLSTLPPITFPATPSIPAIPEPSTWLLFITGGALLASRKFKHRWQSGPMHGIANPESRGFKSLPVLQK